jgi:hypothetical protein
MPREPLLEPGQDLLDDPCHFVRRACQVADYGDPARDAPPAAVAPLEQAAVGDLTRTAAEAVLCSTA